jgi:hypothetical protein
LYSHGPALAPAAADLLLRWARRASCRAGDTWADRLRAERRAAVAAARRDPAAGGCCSNRPQFAACCSCSGLRGDAAAGDRPDRPPGMTGRLGSLAPVTAIVGGALLLVA